MKAHGQTVGDRIRIAMAEAGFKTQTALCKIAEVDGGNLSRLIRDKRGGRPEAETITKLAKALNVTPGWLLDGDEPKRPASDASDVAPGDITIGEFLLKISRDPDHSKRGLNAEIGRRGTWKLRTIVRAATDELECEEDGVPKGGWPKALRTIEDEATAEPAADEATSIVAKQTGPRIPLPPKGSKPKGDRDK